MVPSTSTMAPVVHRTSASMCVKGCGCLQAQFVHTLLGRERIFPWSNLVRNVRDTRHVADSGLFMPAWYHLGSTAHISTQQHTSD